MLTPVVLALGISLLIVVLVGFFMLLEVAFASNRSRDEHQRAVRRWKPPFAHGEELLRWAKDTAAGVARARLADRVNAGTPVALSAELEEGTMHAMLPLATDREIECPIACPDQGQGTVTLTAPETLEIAEYIGRELPRQVRRRIHDLAQRNVEKMAAGEQLATDAAQLPCPLQGDNGICLAYQARPLFCRPLHAATIARQHGLETSASAEKTPQWQAHAETIEEGVREGLLQELSSAERDAGVYELNSALLVALETRHAAKRWSQGEDIFATCQRRP